MPLDITNCMEHGVRLTTIALAATLYSVTAHAQCVGDANHNLSVDLGEVQQCVSAYLGSCHATPRFVDNGDGTVTDRGSGLVWEKKDQLGGIHDVDNLYVWASSGTTPNGPVFTVFLGTLNGGTSGDGANTVTPCFTGHCDWRLPTIQDLQGIVEPTAEGCGSTMPCIDPIFGPTQFGSYWSSTTVSSNADWTWVVYFADGNVYPASKNMVLIAARAVRGGF